MRSSEDSRLSRDSEQGEDVGVLVLLTVVSVGVLVLLAVVSVGVLVL